jgi:acetoin utilization protein AcuB
MAKDVQTVPPSMPAKDAWELMQRFGIRHLVVTAGSDVIGILSDRDAGGKRGGMLRVRSTVGDLMTMPVVTISPLETVRKAANLMRGRTIGSLPVVAGDRLVGIVTISDLLTLVGGAGRIAKVARRRLRRTPRRRIH